MEGRWMIWPERRFVTETEIISWARDLSSNYELPFNGSVEEAIFLIQDVGDGTFAREGVTPPVTTHDMMFTLGFED